MDRLDRQERIDGWDQLRLRDARVLVYGRDWSGAVTVWALAAMGIGEICWVGSPPRVMPAALVNWLLAEPCPFSGVRIIDCPFDIEYAQDIDWVAAHRLSGVISCHADRPGAEELGDYARAHDIPFFAGTGADGGVLGGAGDRLVEQPASGLAVGALLADAVRESLMPLGSGADRCSGRLGLAAPVLQRRAKVAIVGCGGIGVYLATLAAACGYRLVLIDDDRVEASNLNRQGLFTEDDAVQGRPKAEATGDRLTALFPGCSAEAVVERVDASFARGLRRLAPTAICSAVDNAATRLTLQEFGRECGIPVVHGGTGLFAADCFTQDVGGPSLDEQMHGALTAARSQETEARRARRRGQGCAVDPVYVVPGMVCAAMMALRLVQVTELYRGLVPVRWRAGSLPVQEERKWCEQTFDIDIA